MRWVRDSSSEQICLLLSYIHCTHWVNINWVDYKSLAAEEEVVEIISFGRKLPVDVGLLLLINTRNKLRSKVKAEIIKFKVAMFGFKFSTRSSCN